LKFVLVEVLVLRFEVLVLRFEVLVLRFDNAGVEV